MVRIHSLRHSFQTLSRLRFLLSGRITVQLDRDFYPAGGNAPRCAVLLCVAIDAARGMQGSGAGKIAAGVVRRVGCVLIGAVNYCSGLKLRGQNWAPNNSCGIVEPALEPRRGGEIGRPFRRIRSYRIRHMREPGPRRSNLAAAYWLGVLAPGFERDRPLVSGICQQGGADALSGSSPGESHPDALWRRRPTFLARGQELRT